MNTKTGLGLLAAAGLVFGAIGMHAGHQAAAPDPPPEASEQQQRERSHRHALSRIRSRER